MAYQTYVYRSSGGDQLDVDSSGRIKIGSGGEIDVLSGGRLEIAGTPFITSGGNLAIGSLTSGDITTTGSITLTSGINASSGTFTAGVAASTGTFTGGLALTSGITGTTGGFSSGFAIGGNLAVTSGVNATTGEFSSGARFGAAVVFTSGFSATTGNFSAGIAVSSAASVANTLTMSSAASVANTFTMSSAMVRPFETIATGGTVVAIYGISEIWSCGTATGHAFTLAQQTNAGAEKWITCRASTSTAPAVVTLSNTLINGSATITVSTGSANPQWVSLLCQNSTNWMLLGKSTDVTIS